MTKVTRALALVVLVAVVAGCAPSVPSRPDDAQKDEWKSAAWHALPRAVRVGVRGPGNDGSSWFTSVSIDLRQRDLTGEEVSAVVAAIHEATEPGNGDLEVRISFFGGDPTNPSQLGVIRLNDLAGPDAKLGGSGTILIVIAGEPGG